MQTVTVYTIFSSSFTVQMGSLYSMLRQSIYITSYYKHSSCGKSEELDGETVIDALLLYCRPTIYTAVDQMKLFSGLDTFMVSLKYGLRCTKHQTSGCPLAM